MKTTELIKDANEREAELLEKIDLRRLPEHVAIIMDGNGRWAQKRHLPRIAGHRAGVKVARQVIETCARLTIPALTLYAFSLENWRRPQAEVDFLMRLLREYLKKELPVIHRNNIRLLVIGRSAQLPDAVRKDIEKAMRLTAQNTGMKLIVALNYGGRAELVDAFNAILERVRANGLSAFHADEATISNHLYTAGLADTHERGDACEQFSALANCVCGALHYRCAVAGFFARKTAGGAAQFSAARTALRRAGREARIGERRMKRSEISFDAMPVNFGSRQIR